MFMVLYRAIVFTKEPLKSHYFKECNEANSDIGHVLADGLYLTFNSAEEESNTASVSDCHSEFS